MSRYNQNHNPKTVAAFADAFEQAATRIREIAQRMEAMKLKEPVSLPFQASMQQGLVAASRFINQAECKLNLIDERKVMQATLAPRN